MATSIESYLEQFDSPARARLSELVTLARRAAPDAVEAIRWRAPAFVHPDGVILFMLSGHAKHANVVFTPSTKESFAAELAGAGLTTGKGSVKLPYDVEVPAALLERMVAHRVREHEVDGVGWM
ncbi:hypothetical protein GCM10023216_17420 [Isoptericola chiayiensis]|uniref:YdhG-like domain-containing protein n=1 Tax=Isoptericola chiayiensis TaxID=579446 RepID=A0ABP8YER6_9MICO|nr:DUF1801 domain-containing protein [Isoptericola chiayiensis]NOV99970.1 uncharacterized protein YdhG (YjbR/CyaY superfamily) [Isoptericola chiayiensis]